MLSMNAERLEQVVQEAFDKASESGTKDAQRWSRAIVKAWQQLQENPYIHWTGDALLILSPDSNEIYTANGTCGCKAFTTGKYPCWHRAASRLVARYMQTSH